MQIAVRVPGSCGELLEGTCRGQYFLVTCPIDKYTTVTISDRLADSGHNLPEKAERALQAVLQYLGVKAFPYGISIESELPSGKGMAASSADVAAVIIAAGLACGRQLTDAEVMKLAVAIEPTDGVFLPGIVRMNHMTGEIYQSYGQPPRAKIMVFDVGGTVDTESFHQRRDLEALYQQNEPQLTKALSCIKQPLQLDKLMQAATISAMANQSILPKLGLEKLLPWMSEREESGLSVGIITSHSGTVFGILLPSDFAEWQLQRAGRMSILPREGLQELSPATEIIQTIKNIMPHATYCFTANLIGGGAEVICLIKR